MINSSRLSIQFWGFTRILFFYGGFIMLKKFSTKASSFLIAVMMIVATFSTTVEAAKPSGGGGKNTAPVITPVGPVPTLTEDTTTAGEITLSATDKEGNPITWSIVSATLGTATLQPPSSTTPGTSTVKVNYTPFANKNGTAAVTVQAKDSFAAVSKYTVSITVLAVNDPPVSSTEPSISGTIAEGQTVSAINGVWSDVETSAASLAFSYQWQLADDQDGTNAVNTAATKAYTISSGSSGKYIRVGVKATDTGDGTSPSLTSDIAYSLWVLINPPVPVPEVQYYVALGDSISAGTNNQNLIGTSYRYTNTFSSSLAAIFSGTSYSYKNDSVPGDDTDDLLTKLQTDSTIRSDVSKATIITISIGGNNLLSTASARGYSEINDTAANAGVENFASDLPAIVTLINSLHSADHLPQIYIMDMYNLFHPYERGWVTYSDGKREEVFMNQFIYENYLSIMQTAIDTVASQNSKVYRVNTYAAFENYSGRYAITNTSKVKRNVAFSSITNPEGKYFYSPYLEGTAVYSDKLTRFDIYPFTPILFDYANVDKYRDPHPEQEGHNVLKTAHLSKFKEVNHLN
jgi:lysophospholipase L1-like esterase